MRRRGRGGPLGTAIGGCALWFFALIFGGIFYLVFPKAPGYDDTMERGDIVPGEVVRVETMSNTRINGRNPQRVVFRFGDGREASMVMAMDQAAAEGQALQVRVLDDHAYPEGIRPLVMPLVVKLIPVGAALLGTLLLVFGIIRLLVLGGILFAAGRAVSSR